MGFGNGLGFEPTAPAGWVEGSGGEGVLMEGAVGLETEAGTGEGVGIVGADFFGIEICSGGVNDGAGNDGC